MGAGETEIGYTELEQRLRSDLPEVDCARVLALATSRQYAASTLWRWAAEHGAGRLALVIDAGVGESSLLTHLAAGTAPDWSTIAVFAELATASLPAGMPAAELVDPDAVPDLSSLTFPAGLRDWSTERGDRTRRVTTGDDDWPDLQLISRPTEG